MDRTAANPVSGAFASPPGTPARRFKPYPAYKDSGVEWLGEIPAHWRVERLKHTAELHGSISANAADCNGAEGDVCYVSPEELIEGPARTATSRWIEPSVARRFDIVPRGSTAICTIGSVGQSCQFTRPFVTNPQVKGLSARTHVDDRFLALVVLAAKPEVRRLSTVSVMPFINGSTLLELCVPRVPPDEQRAVAAFLDRETAKIDALVAKKERLIQLLQEKRTALITRAVTKGLDSTVPMKDSGVEWLGEIPAHWRALALKRIGDLQAGAGFPDDEQGVLTEDIPFFKVGDMAAADNEREMRECQHTVSEATARRLRAFVFPPGTIVFAKVGAALLLNRRRILTRRSCLDNNMMGFMPGDCDSTWAMYWLSGLDMGELANPGAVPSINEGQVRETPAAVPPVSEQRAIAAFLDRETARIDALVAKVREGIERLKEYRTALISAAVTGKIDVREEVAA